MPTWRGSFVCKTENEWLVAVDIAEKSGNSGVPKGPMKKEYSATPQIRSYKTCTSVKVMVEVGA